MNLLMPGYVYILSIYINNTNVRHAYVCVLLCYELDIQVSFNLVANMRITCDLETYIVSVERIKEYADLQPEVIVLLFI